MPAEWEPAPDRGLGPSRIPRLSSPARIRKKCCYGQKNLGQYVSVCPRLQLTSHTQPTSTLSRIKSERYIFIKKCVRSFIEVVIIVDYVSAYIYIYVYVLCICMCSCMWLYNTVIQIVVGTLGMTLKSLVSGLVKLELRGPSEAIQTTSLLWFARRLRRALETWEYMLSLRHQWKTIS